MDQQLPTLLRNAANQRRISGSFRAVPRIIAGLAAFFEQCRELDQD
jgi:hypothetical protein